MKSRNNSHVSVLSYGSETDIENPVKAKVWCISLHHIDMKYT